MLPFFNKDKPVRIRFYFESQEKNRKRLTWDDLDTLEMMKEGEMSTRRTKALAARFVADDNNQYLPYEKALKLLGSLTEDDIKNVLQRFVEGIQGAAVPPPNGNGSNLTHEVGSVGTLPDGSQR